MGIVSSSNHAVINQLAIAKVSAELILNSDMTAKEVYALYNQFYDELYDVIQDAEMKSDV